MLIKSQSEVCLHTEYSVHFHPIPIYQTLPFDFRGSGSEATQCGPN